MGKSSQNKLADEIKQLETQNDSEETATAEAHLQGQDAAVSTDFDGLVVLESRRRAAGSETMTDGPRSSRRRGGPKDDSNGIGEQIGAQLRTLYDDVLNQPVPDRFMELLNKLEKDTISPTRSKAPGER